MYDKTDEHKSVNKKSSHGAIDTYRKHDKSQLAATDKGEYKPQASNNVETRNQSDPEMDMSMEIQQTHENNGASALAVDLDKNYDKSPSAAKDKEDSKPKASHNEEKRIQGAPIVGMNMQEEKIYTNNSATEHEVLTVEQMLGSDNKGQRYFNVDIKDEQKQDIYKANKHPAQHALKTVAQPTQEVIVIDSIMGIETNSANNNANTKKSDVSINIDTNVIII
jgi:hypothetical protein